MPQPVPHQTQPSRAPFPSSAPNTTGEPLGYVEATVNHHVPTGEKPAIYVAPPGQGEHDRVSRYEARTVRIHDARPIADQLSLDEHGFALAHQQTAVKNFYDDDEVRSVFYPEVERLVKAATGAAKVVIFDHTIRVDGGTANADIVAERGARRPVRTVHNDYTDRSGPQRVRDLIDEAEQQRWLNGRFAVINVWRSIAGTVETAPLAVADARSMAPEDFVSADLVYRDRVGEIHEVAYNPNQRWYYVPRLQAHEALLLKCFDSATGGPARFTAHTAFDDPNAPPNAPPRESIEIRTLVLFDAEDDRAA